MAQRHINTIGGLIRAVCVDVFDLNAQRLLQALQTQAYTRKSIANTTLLKNAKAIFFGNLGSEMPLLTMHSQAPDSRGKEPSQRANIGTSRYLETLNILNFRVFWGASGEAKMSCLIRTF